MNCINRTAKSYFIYLTFFGHILNQSNHVVLGSLRSIIVHRNIKFFVKETVNRKIHKLVQHERYGLKLREKTFYFFIKKISVR